MTKANWVLVVLVLAGPVTSQARDPVPEMPTRVPSAAPPEAVEAPLTAAPNSAFLAQLGIEFVRIPAGSFRMGCDKAPYDLYLDEYGKPKKVAVPQFGRIDGSPAHDVYLDEYAMGKTEVTVGQFRRFVEDTGYQTQGEKQGWIWSVTAGKPGRKDGASWRSPGFEQTDRHPVVGITWDDAMAYCDWLSKKTGNKVHLPSEAQWEMACRAGTRTMYCWGDDPDGGKGWGNAADRALSKVSQISLVFSWSDRYAYTAPVGSFRANAFGLYDMLGNVYEWCSDWHNEEYYERSPPKNPKGPESGSMRVLRGGSWLSPPGRQLESADRLGLDPAAVTRSTIGFRVALD